MAYTVMNGKVIKVKRKWAGYKPGRSVEASTTNIAEMAAANNKAARRKPIGTVSIDGKPVGSLLSLTSKTKDSITRVHLLAFGILKARKMDLAARHEEMYRLAREAEALGLKGTRNGMCNRTQCLDVPALYFNHSTRKHYCRACAIDLNTDRFNKADAQRLYGHDLCTLVNQEPEKRLTDEAQAERDDFVREHGHNGNCSCHISPPCGSCLHPGNPRNQEEDESAWTTAP